MAALKPEAFLSRAATREAMLSTCYLPCYLPVCTDIDLEFSKKHLWAAVCFFEVLIQHKGLWTASTLLSHCSCSLGPALAAFAVFWDVQNNLFSSACVPASWKLMQQVGRSASLAPCDPGLGSVLPLPVMTQSSIPQAMPWTSNWGVGTVAP